MVTTGYRLILPPGWVRIPLRSETSDAVRRLLDKRFGGSPELLVEVRGQFERFIHDARSNGGLDAYLPVADAGRLGGAAVFVITTARSNPREPLPELHSQRQDGNGYTSLVLDGSSSLRRERDAGAEGGTGPRERRVDYLLPVPEESDRWIIATLSTIGIEPCSHLVDLFDAIMTTFRWERATTDVS